MNFSEVSEKQAAEVKTDAALENYHKTSLDTAQAGKTPAKKQPVATPVQRKIVYTADLRMVVEDLDKARKAVADLVEQHKGYVADSNVQGRTGEPRTASWTIRLPAGELDGFRAAVIELGEPEQDKLSSRDVTAEYYDLQTRIRNKEATEKRLLSHLDKETKDLKDILAVEKDLDRVREAIERMKGQLKLLANLVAMTTVNLTVIERKNYVPPQAPSFTTSISRTFTASWEALQEFGKGFVLLVVALAPWLPLIVLFVGLVVWLVKRSRRHSRAGSKT